MNTKTTFLTASLRARCSGALALAASMVVLAALPARAQLLNGNFATTGVNGNPVTVTGPSGSFKESAAKYWRQYIGAPNSSFTSRQGVWAGKFGLQCWTNSGYYAPAQNWSELLQAFATMNFGAFITYDIFVVSGTVDARMEPQAGYYVPFDEFKPMGKWQHVVRWAFVPVTAFDCAVPSADGANFYIANVRIDPFGPVVFVPVVNITQPLLVDPYYYLKNPGAPVEKARITNTGVRTLTGPFHVVLNGLPSGAGLVNSTGLFNGSPYITINQGTLLPGQSMDVTLQFTPNATGDIPAFRMAIFAGTL